MRIYNIKIFKIITPCNNFFITGCYGVRIETHFKRLLKFYTEWKNDLENRKTYQVIFGFFEKFGVDNTIKLLCEYRGDNNSKKEVINYLVNGMNEFEKCHNFNDNISKKHFISNF